MIRIVVALCLLAGLAHADRKKAEQYFRAGERAFQAQNFAAAAQSFELAYQELDLPEIAFSAAQAYRRQFYVDPKPDYAKRAVELYRHYLDKVKTGGRVADASDGLAEMNRELDRIPGRGGQAAGIQRGTRLIVNAIVEGQDRTSMTELSLLPGSTELDAKATIDGEEAKLSAPIDVAAGEHTVVVSAAGYFSITLKKRVEEGETEVAEAVLRPQPAILSIETEAGAQITIDGRPATAKQSLPAGTHVLSIHRRGRVPVVRELTIGRGEQRVLELPLAPTTQRKSVKWVAIGSGVVAALAIGATVLALDADATMSTLADKREREGISADELARYEKAVRRRDQQRDAAWVLGGMTLAGGALAGMLYWFDTPTPSERSTRVVPVIGSEGAGATVVGRF